MSHRSSRDEHQCPKTCCSLDGGRCNLMDIATPTSSIILHINAQTPANQAGGGCPPCRCPSLLTGDEAGAYFWRCATLPPGWLGPRRHPEGHFCCMPYTEVGMYSQGMEKMRGKGARLDAAPAPLCPSCRGRWLIYTQIPVPSICLPTRTSRHPHP